MPDTNFTPQHVAGSGFKEAVCINAGRIYDSCSDKDCIDHLPVCFTDTAQARIEAATNVKCRNVSVLDVYMDIQSVPFNKGFYSVDMTFYFGIHLDVYQLPCLTPIIVEGVSVFSKKVILYGSEGNVNVFSSEPSCCGSCPNPYHKDTTPRATVQVVTPICLSCKLTECCKPSCCINVPMSVASSFEGSFCPIEATKHVEVTLGVFSIVSLERTVQMMIPVYDFCIPDKECTQTNDDPCELFRRIKFPVNEFFPPRLGGEDLEYDTDFECIQNSDNETFQA